MVDGPAGPGTGAGDPDDARWLAPARGPCRPAPARPATRLAGSADATTAGSSRTGFRNPFRIHVPPGNERAVGRRRRLEQTGRRSTGSPTPTSMPCRELRLAVLRGHRHASRATTARTCRSARTCTRRPSCRERPAIHVQPRREGRAGETCPTGSSSITGLAFYPEGGDLSRPPTPMRCSSPTTRELHLGR